MLINPTYPHPRAAVKLTDTSQTQPAGTDNQHHTAQISLLQYLDSNLPPDGGDTTDVHNYSSVED
jgi:hypothetical protein